MPFKVLSVPIHDDDFNFLNLTNRKIPIQDASIVGCGEFTPSVHRITFAESVFGDDEGKNRAESPPLFKRGVLFGGSEVAFNSDDEDCVSMPTGNIGLFGGDDDDGCDSIGGVENRVIWGKQAEREFISPDNSPVRLKIHLTPGRSALESPDLKMDKLRFTGKTKSGGDGFIQFGEVTLGDDIYPVVTKEGKDAFDEYQTATLCESPHVVKMKTVDGSVMMDEAKGTLFDVDVYIKNLLSDSSTSSNIKEYFLLDLGYQLLDGLNEVHSKTKKAHCDLKPQNIYVYGTRQIVVADLGSVAANRSELNGITPAYAAPECLGGSIESSLDIEDEPFTRNVDIFSFSAVMHRMIFGKMYFEWDNPGLMYEEKTEIGKYLKEKKDHSIPLTTSIQFGSDVTPSLKDTMTLLVSGLEIKPSARIGLSRLRKQVVDRMDKLKHEYSSIDTDMKNETWRNWQITQF